MVKIDIDPWADAVARYSRAKTRRIAIIAVAAVLGVAMICATVVAFANSYNATLIRVYDGDTVIARVEIWPGIVAEEVSIRLRGVQAPELGWRASDDCERVAAIAARQFVSDNIRNLFTIVDVEEGTYPGRVVADIIIDGVSLSDLLLSHGHAIPYDGRGRAPRFEC